MDETSTTAATPLLALADADAAVCADGFPVAELAAGEGLDFDFDAALTVNTLDAHRLLHLAADLGIGDAAKERLLRAHFTEGADLSDHETLTRLLGEAGGPRSGARRAGGHRVRRRGARGHRGGPAAGR